MQTNTKETPINMEYSLKKFFYGLLKIMYRNDEMSLNSYLN